MKRDERVFIEHILESIELLEKYTKGKSKSSFLNFVDLQDKAVRRLEIIGEAVKHLPERIKEKYNDVPWKKIAGMRDKLIHEYFGVDLELTWKVIKENIPDLKKEILKIKRDIKRKL